MENKFHYENCEVVIERRKNGIEPALYIKTDKGIKMVLISPDCDFIVEDGTGWDIQNQKDVYIQ